MQISLFRNLQQFVSARLVAATVTPLLRKYRLQPQFYSSCSTNSSFKMLPRIAFSPDFFFRQVSLPTLPFDPTSDLLISLFFLLLNL